MSLKKSYVTNKTAEIVIRSAQDNETEVKFPAFVTSFTNSFSSNWTEEQVYGRIDPIGTFQGTKRRINLGFDIVGASLDEAKENMKNINTLTKMLYPSYTDADGEGEGNALILSKSPLVYIRFGNLIQEDNGFLLGWISTWSANPVLDMGMFTPSKGMFFPKVFNATIDFTPQHRKDLAFDRGAKTNPKFPYDGGE
mgnify:CR=1 FL=1|jgi:hypothetical protein